MQENQTDLLPGNLLQLDTIRRKKLIPLWIKIFTWIFLVFGVLIPFRLLFGILGSNFEMSLYGLETSEPFSVTGITVFVLFLLKGIVSFGLLKEKDWAINLALVDAITGIVVCIFLMIYPSIEGNGGFNFRLELIFLVPYLLKMREIKPAWDMSLQP